MKIAVVVGNPKPASRTLRVAESLAGVIEKLVPGEQTEYQVIDLAEHSSRLFEWPEPTLAALNDAVAASDVLVVASPTYKATYTGLLKAFLDRYPSNGLAGVVAVPVMTGAAADHAMATEVNLRPLLVELGATVPSRGLYLVMNRIAELDQITADWGQANAATLVPAITGRLEAPRD
ncbi:NAD(P)H-dependent oxidoreductase [Kineosporia sp. J2-2]|uniref:NAD(P)H-dependent oxidoreductase n=1 Tax=Kineosporia corallincola TaxID=2835133 RepID=A0ABS5T911_9ACTN|nr:NAD(P)H-dependent oxidoreductase [Kineosporia corallincola]MBT0767557.1 NAD(P)H-dependent oxidoreductase [Kineosporia corallincola]